MVDHITLSNLIKNSKIYKWKNMLGIIVDDNKSDIIKGIKSLSSTNIIELNVETPHQISKQYYDICNSFNIPYTKFICDKVDQNDNMSVNINDFISLIKNKDLI
jgi:hypothetical protein